MFSALYIGSTGISAQGERMQTIGDNLANVSTIGFKKADTVFENLISQQLAVGSNRFVSGVNDMSQIGMGVGVNTVRTDYTQGSFEIGSESTDLAIAGRGFFGLRNSVDGTYAYTRAGNFRFDADAYMTNPSDLRLQGYAVDRDTGAVAATATDIQLPYEDEVIDGVQTRVVKAGPVATTSVTMDTNLDYGAEDRVSDSVNPFFALFTHYNGTSSTPLSGLNPDYETSIRIYDETGATHTLTFAYDRVDETLLSNATGGNRYWEFLAYVNPTEDGRSGMVGTSAAGVMAMGTLTFNRYGEMVDQSVFTLQTPGAGAKALSNWTPSGFSTIGYPAFDTAFLLSNGAVTAGQTVGVDFGLSSSNATWIVGSNSTAGAMGANVQSLPRMSGIERSAYATTDYNAGSATLMHTQNGYPPGFLQSLEVDRDGFLTGHFTNQQTQRLFQVALYRVPSEDGLRREGGNIYLATQDSGVAVAGAPGTGGRGTVEQKTLEMANVDMAEEFVKMILTQRGFQANTKVMTTADSIMQIAMQMKH